MVWPGPFEKFPSFLWCSWGFPLNFRVHAVQSSARKPTRKDGFSLGLVAFWFLWSAGASVAPSIAILFLPRPSSLKKRDEAFCHKKCCIFFSACKGWLVETAFDKTFRQPFVETLNKPIDT